MTEKGELETQILIDMMRHCDEIGNYSYYDLKAYAFENEKHDWIKLLKNKTFRGALATCLKSAKRVHKVKYETPMHISSRKALEAQLEYYKKYGRDDTSFYQEIDCEE